MPRSRSKHCFLALPAVANTLPAPWPHRRAAANAASPAPPEAACKSRRSPQQRRAQPVSAAFAVRKTAGSAAASSEDTPLGRSADAGMFGRSSARVPGLPAKPKTGSPEHKVPAKSHPMPTECWWPLANCPATREGIAPRSWTRSKKFRPTASTETCRVIRASRLAACGVSRKREPTAAKDFGSGILQGNTGLKRPDAQPTRL